MACDERFHEMIVQAAGNAYVTEFSGTPLPGLAHGSLGQAHQRKAGQPLAHQIHFHVHRKGIHPFQAGAVQSYDHNPPPPPSALPLNGLPVRHGLLPGPHDGCKKSAAASATAPVIML